MMKTCFLDFVRRKFKNDDYAGDEFGGAAGSDGSGLPTGSAGNFLFATGFYWRPWKRAISKPALRYTSRRLSFSKNRERR